MNWRRVEKPSYSSSLTNLTLGIRANKQKKIQYKTRKSADSKEKKKAKKSQSSVNLTFRAKYTKKKITRSIYSLTHSHEEYIYKDFRKELRPMLGSNKDWKSRLVESLPISIVKRSLSFLLLFPFIDWLISRTYPTTTSFSFWQWIFFFSLSLFVQVYNAINDVASQLSRISYTYKEGNGKTFFWRFIHCTCCDKFTGSLIDDTFFF